MQKRLRFYYRYFFASGRWRRWLNFQWLVVVLLSAVFLAALFMTAPISRFEVANRPAVGGVAEASDSYPVPAGEVTEISDSALTATMYVEFVHNSDQTVGLTLIGMVLVLIVVFGALMYIPRDGEE